MLAGPIEADRDIRAYKLDDQVGFLLRRAYQRASANLIDKIGTFDFTPPQFATLARLYERGKVSQNLLGRLVAMEPANIRDVVLRLKKRRLTTQRDPADGRLLLVSLTPTGLSLVRGLLKVEMESTSKTLAPLDHDERRVLCAAELVARTAHDGRRSQWKKNEMY